MNAALPVYGGDARELVPVLIRSETGIPPLLPLRWVMRDRRLAVGEKKLSDEVRSAALLYSFCEDILRSDGDELFSNGTMLLPRELDQLFDYLRSGHGGRGIRALSTTAQLVANIEVFLYWLADIAGRGGKRHVPGEDLAVYRQRLTAVLKPLRAVHGKGSRKAPLPPMADRALEALIGPLKDASGRYLSPISFAEGNPWERQTRLRNWIAYRLGRELGLRRGEIGKIRIDDVTTISGDVAVSIRRRPHDASDTRRGLNRPKVKSVERILPVSRVLAQGIRQYMHSLLQHGGRRGAQTPYLLVTADGAPISGTSLDKAWNAPSRHTKEPKMSWHVLRHTWAEEAAENLLAKYISSPSAEEVALGVLRELGGWAPNSPTPFKYIQNALRSRGMEYLRERNAHFDAPNDPS